MERNSRFLIYLRRYSAPEGELADRYRLEKAIGRV